jgi:hypothetical protein
MRMTREQAVEKYGAIDFHSRYWPKQSHFLVMADIPPDWFPKWKVAVSGYPPVHHIAINVDAERGLMDALYNIKMRGLGDLLQTFDGCFNIRTTRGSSSISAHAYALAIDINAIHNPLGATHGGHFDSPEFVKCWTDAGWYWGGNFQGRKDPMHMSWTGF